MASPNQALQRTGEAPAAELGVRRPEGFGDMRPPITWADRVQSAATLLLLGGLALWVGLALLRAIGRSSPARRRHGKFVLGWMLAGWLVGGAYGVYLIDNRSYYPGEADGGCAGFGLLLGWVVGMVHGGIVLAVWPLAPAAEPGAAADTGGVTGLS